MISFIKRLESLLSKVWQYDNHRDFEVPFVNLFYHGSEGISYAGPKIWDIVLSEIKQINCLHGYKKSVRKRIPTYFACKLCGTYISG